MSLRKRAVRGLLWTGAGNVVTGALNFSIVAVLAHFLSPADFGLMGMVLLVIGFITMISDFGLGTAVIQEELLTASQVSTFFYVNLILGVILGALVYCLAPLISSFFKNTELTTLLHLIAIVFLLTGIGSTFRTILQKEMRFAALSVTELSGIVAYGIVSITLAILGYGVKSLVYGVIIRQFVEVSILWFIVRYRLTSSFRLTEIRHLLRFGTFVFGERILNYLNRNIDYLLIGRFLGTELLGYYTLAYQIILVPISKVAQVVGKVTYPVFSKVQKEPEKMQGGYIIMLKYIALIAFPFVTVLFVVTPEFIRSVYGKNWDATISVLQIFCLYGAIESIGTTVGGVLYAKNRADIAFSYNIINVAIVASAVSIGLHYGIIGVATSLTCVSLPLAYLWQRKTNLLIRLSWRSFFSTLSFPLVVSVILLPSIYVVKLLGRAYFYNNDMGILLISFGSAIIIFILTIGALKRSLMTEVKTIFSHVNS
jgi:O-antigen/teichoic acid export membrane protein